MPKQSNVISFWVPGACQTAGSKSYKGNNKYGKAIIIDSCKRSPEWKGVVATFALRHRPKQLLTGPLEMECTFYMRRPKSHYVAGDYAKGLKRNMPRYHTTKPDGLKLRRAIEDALAGIIYHDDAQIADGRERKLYSDEPDQIGVKVEIRKLKE